MVQNDKRNRTPAVTHVDGSFRLQLITPQAEAEPLYHKLVTIFNDFMSAAMALNTLHKLANPMDRCFLCYKGSIELLVMCNYSTNGKMPSSSVYSEK